MALALARGGARVRRGLLDQTDVARGSVDSNLPLAGGNHHSHAAPEACRSALDGIERVSKIIRAMRAFSHPDQQDQAPTNLNAVLENTILVAQGAYRAVADIETDFSDVPDVLCHAGEISQAFLNLVVNATHAIEDAVKGTDRRGTITVTTRLDHDDAVISIRDTGGGIPGSIRDRVFDPFFTTKVVGRGCGQGLALVRTAIVDRHGGSIAFETQLGAGTTFVIRLPVHGPATRSLAAV
jgi:signal transduction histidine kinase